MRKRIIVAAIYLPLFVIVLFFLPTWCSAVLASLLALIAAWELLYNTGLVKNGLPLWLSVAAAACASPLLWFSCPLPYAVGFYFAVTAILFAYAMWHTDRFQFAHIGACLFAYLVIPVLFAVFPALAREDYGKYLLVLPFLTAWSCDTFAYFTGMTLGKHKLIEHISAKKTVEGAVGGILGCILSLMVYGLIVKYAFGLTVHFPALFLIGLCGSVISQIGDLSMSLIKRENHIKDYGNIMPGHGGILDRFDSVLFVLPVVWAVAHAFSIIA